jgi:hypothetical protein
MRNLTSVWVALLLVWGAGCATTTAPTTSASAPPSAAPLSTVSDADFGRLAPDQIQPVVDARAEVDQARNELGRAKLEGVNDQHEGELARSDQAQSSADMSRAVVEGRIGQDSNDPGQKQQAADDSKAAQQDSDAANARLVFAKKLTISRAAQVTAAERKVDLAVEKVNVAKLQSLEDAAMPAAGKYDHAAAMERVMIAQRAYDSATVTANNAVGETTAAHERWQYLVGKNRMPHEEVEGQP